MGFGADLVRPSPPQIRLTPGTSGKEGGDRNVGGYLQVSDVERFQARLKDRVAVHEPLAKGSDERHRIAMEPPDHHVPVFRQITEGTV